MPQVSIILPVYNASKYIRPCIESILGQSYEDFELIIIPNGSDHATLKAIHGFSDPRIRIQQIPTPDVVAAMNHGLNLSKGSFIARIDADDIMPVDRIRAQTEFLKCYPQYEVVSGKVAFVGNAQSQQGYYLHVKWLNQHATYEDIYLNRFVDAPVANPSIMVRRSLFDRLGLYRSGPFPEDYEMLLRWLDNGVKIGKVKECVLQWRDHPARLTRNHPSYSQEAFYRIKTTYLARHFERWALSKKILIWGTGRSIRAKARFLQLNDFDIQGRIDVRKHTASHSADGIPIYHYTDFPKGIFVLSFVGDRKGRLKIIDYLIEKGYKQGADFYLMA